MIHIDRHRTRQLIAANLLTVLIVLCVAVATLVVVLTQGTGP